MQDIVGITGLHLVIQDPSFCEIFFSVHTKSLFVFAVFRTMRILNAKTAIMKIQNTFNKIIKEDEM